MTEFDRAQSPRPPSDEHLAHLSEADRQLVAHLAHERLPYLDGAIHMALPDLVRELGVPASAGHLVLVALGEWRAAVAAHHVT